MSNKSLTVHGVLCGVKEKRLRDGKKDRRWSARVEQAGTGEVVVSRIQAESKEGRYVIRRGDTSYAIFDPEECLHVGRHDGAVGIVYRFKRLVWRGDPRDYSPSGERGLIPWDGGGWQSLARTVAEFAVERTGQRVPGEVVEAMSKAGAWGRLEFWEDLAKRHGLAMQLDIIKEVMDS